MPIRMQAARISSSSSSSSETTGVSLHFSSPLLSMLRSFDISGDSVFIFVLSTYFLLSAATSSWSSMFKLLKLVAVENWIGVLSSLNLVSLSSKTVGFGSVFCSNFGCASKVAWANFGLRDLGLGGSVWVGESGSSLGDIMPLVSRLKQTQH